MTVGDGMLMWTELFAVFGGDMVAVLALRIVDVNGILALNLLLVGSYRLALVILQMSGYRTRARASTDLFPSVRLHSEKHFAFRTPGIATIEEPCNLYDQHCSKDAQIKPLISVIM